jgi:hypothetical protein
MEEATDILFWRGAEREYHFVRMFPSFDRQLIFSNDDGRRSGCRKTSVQFLEHHTMDKIRNIVVIARRQRGRYSSPGRVKNFLFSMSSRPTLGPTQPPIQRVPGVLSPGIKRHGLEAGYSPPASVEIKKI